MKTTVEQTLARLQDQNVKVPADEVESHLRPLVGKFGIIRPRNSRGVV